MRALFCVLLAGVVLVAHPARGQSPKAPRVGVVAERAAGDPFIEAFRDELRTLGHVEGRSIHVEVRHAGGDTDRFPALTAELLAANVDVLVVGGALSVRAARAATRSVPIVFTQVGDPVGMGIVASLARPGGNVTGVSNVVHSLAAKQLEILKSAVPGARRVGVIHNPQNSKLALVGVEQAARALGVDLRFGEVRRGGDLAAAFAATKSGGVDALLLLSDPVLGAVMDDIVRLSARERLPAMYVRREFAQAGGLIAYGPDFSANYRRAAVYVDRILKGARPADLPVEQPTKFELAVNLRAARGLGLTLPPALLQRADLVVE